VAEGWTLEQTLERAVESDRFTLPEDDPRAATMHGRHHYNVQRTYRAMKDG
jgi:hypothetical protein